MADRIRFVHIYLRDQSIFILPASPAPLPPLRDHLPEVRLPADATDCQLGEALASSLAASERPLPGPPEGDQLLAAGVKAKPKSGSAGVLCVAVEAFADGLVTVTATRQRRGWGFEWLRHDPIEAQEPEPKELARMVRRALELAS